MFEHSRRFLNLILLSGSLEDKLAACHAAGFSEVELWRQDVESVNKNLDSVNNTLKNNDIGLTDYQVLLDFDGAPDAIREAKRAEAIAMLDTAQALGAKTLLTPACTHKDCVKERIVEDLRWLCDEAAKRGIRIAYEAMAWSTINHYTPDGWRTVCEVGADNLGMVIDAFHIFVRHRTAADIADIPADRIFLVQLSDLKGEPTPDHLVDTARHHRLLPGQGDFPIQTILDALAAKGYAGPIGLEVFNDDLKAQDPPLTATQAMASLKAFIG